MRFNRPGNNDIVEFNLHCTMKRCWANEFMSFLSKMQEFGNVGHSEVVGFYADGDGDFHPKFTTDFNYTKTEPIKSKESEIILYDAG